MRSLAAFLASLRPEFVLSAKGKYNLPLVIDPGLCARASDGDGCVSRDPRTTRRQLRPVCVEREVLL
jgi:hypothetical protein